jgi:hypothetical protein
MYVVLRHVTETAGVPCTYYVDMRLKPLACYVRSTSTCDRNRWRAMYVVRRHVTETAGVLCT